MAPARMVLVVVLAKYPHWMIEEIAFNAGMALEKFLQVVMFFEIALAVDQLRIVTQLRQHFGVILKKCMKLANFVAQSIVVAPGRGG